MNLSEMRRLLASRNLQLTKSLGQNFLHDGNQLRRIAAAADLVESDRVLEVGPGPGGLTRGLLAEGARRVLAVAKVGSRVRPACLDLSEHVDGCAASMWASRHQAWPAASESPRLMKQL